MLFSHLFGCLPNIT